MIRKLLFLLLLATPCSAQWYAGAGYHQTFGTSSNPAMYGAGIEAGTQVGPGWAFVQVVGFPTSSKYSPGGIFFTNENDARAKNPKTSFVDDPSGLQLRYSLAYDFPIASWLAAGPLVGLSTTHVIGTGYYYSETSNTPISYGAFYEATRVQPNFGLSLKLGAIEEHRMIFSLDYGTHSGVGAGLMLPF